MKSRIEKVLIIPTDLLMNRKLKYFIKGEGWRDEVETINKRVTANNFLNVEAVINPDYIHIGIVEYLDKEFVYTTELKSCLYKLRDINIAPLIFYRGNCRRVHEKS